MTFMTLVSTSKSSCISAGCKNDINPLFIAYLIVFHEVNRKITEKFTILMAINPLNNQIKYKVKLNYLPLLIGNQPFLFMDLINLIPEGHVLSGGSSSCLGRAAMTVPSVLQSIKIFIWKSAIINNNVNKIERT